MEKGNTILNELTVGEFLGIYPPSVQRKMAELEVYYIENGVIHRTTKEE